MPRLPSRADGWSSGPGSTIVVHACVVCPLSTARTTAPMGDAEEDNAAAQGLGQDVGVGAQSNPLQRF